MVGLFDLGLWAKIGLVADESSDMAQSASLEPVSCFTFFPSTKKGTEKSLYGLLIIQYSRSVIGGSKICQCGKISPITLFFSSLFLSDSMATATAPKVENPKKPTDLNSAPPTAEDATATQPPRSSGGGGDEGKGKPDDATAGKPSDVDGGGAVTDIQKKMKRAERFGMPVHLSEQEKRNSRAERVRVGIWGVGNVSSFKIGGFGVLEMFLVSNLGIWGLAIYVLSCLAYSSKMCSRASIIHPNYTIGVSLYLPEFGTGSTAIGLDSSKQSEELKRKARAERFGIVQSAPADEEVKKKARLARFGSSSLTDSAEEDKKKARALRFSQLDSNTKANVRGNVEVKTAIAGKAGGGT
ncbi:UNVERIFIED_CONTAM: Protein MODIFIER OF SNC1 11 [Sesamum indicum]